MTDNRFIYQVDDLERLVISGKNVTLPAETVRYYNANGTNLIYSPEKLELYVE